MMPDINILIGKTSQRINEITVPLERLNKEVDDELFKTEFPVFSDRNTDNSIDS